jgi:hypothetical protein
MLKGSDTLLDQGVEERMTLKCTLKEWGRKQAGLIWLRIQ